MRGLDRDRVKLTTPLAQRLVDYLCDHTAENDKRAAAEPRLSGQLKATAGSAWHLGAYPKPKTTPPNAAGRPARSMPAAKPPSNRAYHADVTKSMVDPARGTRLGLES